MSVHQHTGMQPAVRRGERVAQEVQVAIAVRVVEKAGQPIVPALNDVLRNAGQVESGLASHARSVGTRARRSDSKWAVIQ